MESYRRPEIFPRRFFDGERLQHVVHLEALKSRARRSPGPVCPNVEESDAVLGAPPFWKFRRQCQLALESRY
jgi:hypothetical protein